ncbi:hypothetical protein [Dendronalium sp. ChiSLP03b]|uniref:hypothetical protein n=1 Tax=Dendronalium sp. ChiSLP03b TaxID=3075381 RepID=UPI002ADB6DF5|nr:hypothetical protein [Dendronalium sp. ChiSLP03b]
MPDARDARSLLASPLGRGLANAFGRPLGEDSRFAALTTQSKASAFGDSTDLFAESVLAG